MMDSAEPMTFNHGLVDVVAVQCLPLEISEDDFEGEFRRVLVARLPSYWQKDANEPVTGLSLPLRRIAAFPDDFLERIVEKLPATASSLEAVLDCLKAVNTTISNVLASDWPSVHLVIGATCSKFRLAMYFGEGGRFETGWTYFSQPAPATPADIAIIEDNKVGRIAIACMPSGDIEQQVNKMVDTYASDLANPGSEEVAMTFWLAASESRCTEATLQDHRKTTSEKYRRVALTVAKKMNSIVILTDGAFDPSITLNASGPQAQSIGATIAVGTDEYNCHGESIAASTKAEETSLQMCVDLDAQVVSTPNILFYVGESTHILSKRMNLLKNMCPKLFDALASPGEPNDEAIRSAYQTELFGRLATAQVPMPADDKEADSGFIDFISDSANQNIANLLECWGLAMVFRDCRRRHSSPLSSDASKDVPEEKKDEERRETCPVCRKKPCAKEQRTCTDDVCQETLGRVGLSSLRLLQRRITLMQCDRACRFRLHNAYVLFLELKQRPYVMQDNRQGSYLLTSELCQRQDWSVLQGLPDKDERKPSRELFVEKLLPFARLKKEEDAYTATLRSCFFTALSLTEPAILMTTRSTQTHDEKMADYTARMHEFRRRHTVLARVVRIKSFDNGTGCDDSNSDTGVMSTHAQSVVESHPGAWGLFEYGPELSERTQLRLTYELGRMTSTYLRTPNQIRVGSQHGRTMDHGRDHHWRQQSVSVKQQSEHPVVQDELPVEQWGQAYRDIVDLVSDKASCVQKVVHDAKSIYPKLQLLSMISSCRNDPAWSLNGAAPLALSNGADHLFQYGMFRSSQRVHRNRSRGRTSPTPGREEETLDDRTKLRNRFVNTFAPSLTWPKAMACVKALLTLLEDGFQHTTKTQKQKMGQVQGIAQDGDLADWIQLAGHVEGLTGENQRAERSVNVSERFVSLLDSYLNRVLSLAADDALNRVRLSVADEEMKHEPSPDDHGHGATEAHTKAPSHTEVHTKAHAARTVLLDPNCTYEQALEQYEKVQAMYIQACGTCTVPHHVMLDGLGFCYYKTKRFREACQCWAVSTSMHTTFQGCSEPESAGGLEAQATTAAYTRQAAEALCDCVLLLLEMTECQSRLIDQDLRQSSQALRQTSTKLVKHTARLHELTVGSFSMTGGTIVTKGTALDLETPSADLKSVGMDWMQAEAKPKGATIATRGLAVTDKSVGSDGGAGGAGGGAKPPPPPRPPAPPPPPPAPPGPKPSSRIPTKRQSSANSDGGAGGAGGTGADGGGTHRTRSASLADKEHCGTMCGAEPGGVKKLVEALEIHYNRSIPMGVANEGTSDGHKTLGYCSLNPAQEPLTEAYDNFERIHQAAASLSKSTAAAKPVVSCCAEPLLITEVLRTVSSALVFPPEVMKEDYLPAQLATFAATETPLRLQTSERSTDDYRFFKHIYLQLGDCPIECRPSLFLGPALQPFATSTSAHVRTGDVLLQWKRQVFEKTNARTDGKLGTANEGPLIAALERLRSDPACTASELFTFPTAGGVRDRDDSVYELFTLPTSGNIRKSLNFGTKLRQQLEENPFATSLSVEKGDVLFYWSKKEQCRSPWNMKLDVKTLRSALAHVEVVSSDNRVAGRSVVKIEGKELQFGCPPEARHSLRLGPIFESQWQAVDVKEGDVLFEWEDFRIQSFVSPHNAKVVTRTVKNSAITFEEAIHATRVSLEESVDCQMFRFTDDDCEILEYSRLVHIINRDDNSQDALNLKLSPCRDRGSSQGRDRLGSSQGQDLLRCTLRTALMAHASSDSDRDGGYRSSATSAEMSHTTGRFDGTRHSRPVRRTRSSTTTAEFLRGALERSFVSTKLGKFQLPAYYRIQAACCLIYTNVASLASFLSIGWATDDGTGDSFDPRNFSSGVRDPNDWTFSIRKECKYDPAKKCDIFVGKPRVHTFNDISDVRKNFDNVCYTLGMVSLTEARNRIQAGLRSEPPQRWQGDGVANVDFYTVMEQVRGALDATTELVFGRKCIGKSRRKHFVSGNQGRAAEGYTSLVEWWEASESCGLQLLCKRNGLNRLCDWLTCLSKKEAVDEDSSSEDMTAASEELGFLVARVLFVLLGNESAFEAVVRDVVFHACRVAHERLELKCVDDDEGRLGALCGTLSSHNGSEKFLIRVAVHQVTETSVDSEIGTVDIPCTGDNVLLVSDVKLACDNWRRQQGWSAGAYTEASCFLLPFDDSGQAVRVEDNVPLLACNIRSPYKGAEPVACCKVSYEAVFVASNTDNPVEAPVVSRSTSTSTAAAPMVTLPEQEATVAVAVDAGGGKGLPSSPPPLPPKDWRAKPPRQADRQNTALQPPVAVPPTSTWRSRSILDVPWDEAEWVLANRANCELRWVGFSGGSVVGVKSSSSTVCDEMAREFGRLCKIPIHDSRIVEWVKKSDVAEGSRCEWREIKHCFKRLLKPEQITDDIDRVFYTVLQFVQGSSGLHAFAITPNAETFPSHQAVFHIGQLLAIDVAMNNTDRFPFGCWDHEQGNVENLIVQPDRVVAIDSTMSPLEATIASPYVKRATSSLRQVIESGTGLSKLQRVCPMLKMSWAIDAIRQGLESGVRCIAALSDESIATFIGGFARASAHAVWVEEIKRLETLDARQFLMTMRDAFAAVIASSISSSLQEGRHGITLLQLHNAHTDAGAAAIQRVQGGPPLSASKLDLAVTVLDPDSSDEDYSRAVEAMQRLQCSAFVFRTAFAAHGTPTVAILDNTRGKTEHNDPPRPLLVSTAAGQVLIMSVEQMVSHQPPANVASLALVVVYSPRAPICYTPAQSADQNPSAHDLRLGTAPQGTGTHHLSSVSNTENGNQLCDYASREFAWRSAFEPLSHKIQRVAQRWGVSITVCDMSTRFRGRGCTFTATPHLTYAMPCAHDKPQTMVIPNDATQESLFQHSCLRRRGSPRFSVMVAPIVSTATVDNISCSGTTPEFVTVTASATHSQLSIWTARDLGLIKHHCDYRGPRDRGGSFSKPTEDAKWKLADIAPFLSDSNPYRDDVARTASGNAIKPTIAQLSRSFMCALGGLVVLCSGSSLVLKLATTGKIIDHVKDGGKGVVGIAMDDGFLVTALSKPTEEGQLIRLYYISGARSLRNVGLVDIASLPEAAELKLIEIKLSQEDMHKQDPLNFSPEAHVERKHSAGAIFDLVAHDKVGSPTAVSENGQRNLSTRHASFVGRTNFVLDAKESATSVTMCDSHIAVGTNFGNVLVYQLTVLPDKIEWASGCQRLATRNEATCVRLVRTAHAQSAWPTSISAFSEDDFTHNADCAVFCVVAQEDTLDITVFTINKNWWFDTGAEPPTAIVRSPVWGARSVAAIPHVFNTLCCDKSLGEASPCEIYERLDGTVVSHQVSTAARHLLPLIAVGDNNGCVSFIHSHDQDDSHRHNSNSSKGIGSRPATSIVGPLRIDSGSIVRLEASCDGRSVFAGTSTGRLVKVGRRRGGWQ